VWYELSGTVAGGRMAGQFSAAGQSGRWTARRH
jgi:hypothetical protein